MSRCPVCGASIVEQGDVEAEAEARAIREWATSQRVPTFGNRIRLEDAARYLNRSAKTLRNWISCRNFPVIRMAGRTYCEIGPLAQWIIEN